MRLTPPVNTTTLLVEMVSVICKQFKLRYNLTIAINTEQFVEPKQIEVRQLMSRSIRELLFNIVKYAQVSRAEVKLWSTSDYNYCVGYDQGVGFNVKELPTDESFIRTWTRAPRYERATAMIGGDIEITSQIHQGTSIKLSIPTATSLKTTSQSEDSVLAVTAFRLSQI